MDVKSFNSITELLSFLKEKSESSLFCELCGMVGLNKKNKIIYAEMKNRSPEPDKFFVVDPYDFLKFIKDFTPIALFHSHVYGDENPSDFDIKSSNNSCLAFLIYSVTTEKFFIYEPQVKKYDVSIIEGIRNLLW
jgi:proteasome lid subunit RPN8/RPN11